MDQTIAQLAAGAAGAASLPELARTLHPLKQLTGAAHAALYLYDERGAMKSVGGDSWIEDVYWPYFAEDPVQAETRRVRQRPGFALADRLVERKRLRHSRVYAEFYARCEMEHLCCIFLTPLAHGSPGMTNIFLARGPKQQPYDEEQLTLVRQVMPILSAAVERLRRMPSSGGEQSLLEWGRQQPCLTTSIDGVVDWLSPAARILLGEYAPARLPTALAARIGLLLRERWGVAATSAHWRLPNGRLLRVDLSPTSLVDGQARVLVLLSPVAISERFALTPAEVHVIECLAAGNSTLEIAGILALSEATVRTHLRNIYRKLRVCSRTEAVLEWQARADAKVA
jgi:DNA-binding CsgD family transcriptional regulator